MTVLTTVTLAAAPDPAWSWNPVVDVRAMWAYPFMVNAFRAGTVVAVVAGVLGWFMVLRRQSFAGHTLAVVGFPGAAGAALLGVGTGYGYFAFCVGAALVIGGLSGGRGVGGGGGASRVRGAGRTGGLPGRRRFRRTGPAGALATGREPYAEPDVPGGSDAGDVGLDGAHDSADGGAREGAQDTADGGAREGAQDTADGGPAGVFDGAPHSAPDGARAALTGTVQAFLLACGYLFSAHYNGLLGGVTSLLFGSFLGITNAQVWVLSGVAVAVLLLLGVIGRPLLFASVDPAVAVARGVPTRLLSTTFLVLLGAAAAATSQITGTLLVFALLVTPAASAQALTARPGLGLALSVGIALTVTWLGLTVAYYSSCPIGFSVTTFAFGGYVLARLAGLVRQVWGTGTGSGISPGNDSEVGTGISTGIRGGTNRARAGRAVGRSAC